MNLMRDHKPLKIQTKITLLAFALVALAVAIGGVFLVENFSRTMENELASRALAIGRTLAQMEEIQLNVGRQGGWEVIQPIAERTRLATNVEYIVVTGMDGVRYSHPVQDYIGQPFSGDDIKMALANNEYYSRAEGILGPSVRAFVPIKTDEGTRQVGVVVVGILTPTISKLLHQVRLELYLALAAALVVGALGAVYLARNIKKSMFDLEPGEIARILEERVAIFQSTGEGIIAIDRDHRITIMNDEAKRLMRIEGEVIGKPVQEVLPDTRLIAVAEDGVEVYNQERRLANGNTILVNRLPIRVKGRIVGAVSTFRDMTEVKTLAEELTGVKKYIEALRVQNHEHRNKLHTIAGLVQLGRYQEAVDYIFDVNKEEEEVSRFLTDKINNFAVAAILLGKFSRARELKVNLEFDPRSRLAELPPALDPDRLVTIIGNLLDNALEAVAPLARERRRVSCRLEGKEDRLELEVSDQGPGLPAEADLIFEPGFSTKSPGTRGYGLALVKEKVADLGGTLSCQTGPQGTTFLVRLPLKEENHD